MNFQKVNRPTSSEVIVDQIRQRIASGQLNPGDRLPPERELSSQFGVCRASVREATRALAMMGFIEVFQGKGAFVKKRLSEHSGPSSKLDEALMAGDSLDLVDVRNVLECKAVALAAIRATPAQVARISQIIATMTEAQNEPARFYQADLEFHQAVAAASNNRVLVEIMNLLWDKMVADRENFLGFADGDCQACLHTAKQVRQAIAAGQPEKAIAAMTRHLHVVGNEVLTHVHE